MKLPLVHVPRYVPFSSWKDGPILLFHLARGFLPARLSPCGRGRTESLRNPSAHEHESVSFLGDFLVSWCLNFLTPLSKSERFSGLRSSR